MDKDTTKKFMHYAYWVNDGDPHIVEYKKKYGRKQIVEKEGFDFYDAFLRYIVEKYSWKVWKKLWR